MKQDTLISKIMIGVLLLAVTAYLVFSGLRTLTNPYQFLPVFSDSVEDSLSLSSWAFREEERLPAADGVISYRVDEGEKLKAWQAAAISYENQAAMAQQQRLRALSDESSQLKFAMAADGPTGQNLESQILSSIIRLEISSASGDFTQLPTQADQYKKLVLRREYTGSDAAAAELGSASLALTEELASLQLSQSETTETIYSPAAGVFATYVDGYEQVYAPALLKELGPQEFAELVKKKPESNAGSIGKIITSNSWHLCMLVPEQQLTLFRKQTQVYVRTPNSSEPLPMKVSYISFSKGGQALVQLSSNENLDQVLSLREQTVSVIFRSEQGFRIPKNALRLWEDKEGVSHSGVYVVTGYAAEFKPVRVLAEDREDYIVAANPDSTEDKRILRTGDEIILSSEDLYIGKVVR